MKKRLLVTRAFVIALIGSTQSAVYRSTQDQQIALSKIELWVLERTANGQEAEFLVIMADQADLSGAERLRTKREKGRFVYQALYNKAQQTQGQVLGLLKAQGIEHRSYYIINMVWARSIRRSRSPVAQTWPASKATRWSETSCRSLSR